MIERRKVRPTVVALAAAAITALGVGGAALAQSSGSTPNQPAQSQPAQPAQQQTAPDQKAPEQTAPENSATDRDNVQDENGKDDATEGPEKAEGSETAETPGQESPEVANDDGPGGHADEPGNPNADHQAQGKE